MWDIEDFVGGQQGESKASPNQTEEENKGGRTLWLWMISCSYSVVWVIINANWLDAGCIWQQLFLFTK